MTVLRNDTSALAEAGLFQTLRDAPCATGIINSGGVLADGVLAKQSVSTLRTAFAPKLASALAMDHSTEGLPLSQVLLFSSVASLLGGAGQANYAAANAALEGWVGAKAAQGTNGLAVQWGAWAAGGHGKYALARPVWWTCFSWLTSTAGSTARSWVK